MSAAANTLPPYPQGGYDRLARYPGLLPQCRPYGNNIYDDCLALEYVAWGQMLANGGLKSCAPQGRRKYSTPPWVSMPREGRRFRPIGVGELTDFQTLGLFNGLDVAVLQMRVPLGYDGVISDVVANFSGSGFVEGSGDITWRLAADDLVDATGVPTARYLRDMGNLITSIGSLTQPSPVPRGGLRIYSDDNVTFYCAITPGAVVANGNILVSFAGWVWPR